jgi:hypothetical protein
MSDFRTQTIEHVLSPESSSTSSSFPPCRRSRRLHPARRRHLSRHRALPSCGALFMEDAEDIRLFLFMFAISNL